MVNRCNARPECQDKSDEINCATLSRIKENFGTYDKTLTPVSGDSSALAVNVAAEVKEIVQIGEIQYRFKCFMTMYYR